MFLLDPPYYFHKGHQSFLSIIEKNPMKMVNKTVKIMCVLKLSIFFQSTL